MDPESTLIKPDLDPPPPLDKPEIAAHSVIQPHPILSLRSLSLVLFGMLIGIAAAAGGVYMFLNTSVKKEPINHALKRVPSPTPTITADPTANRKTYENLTAWELKPVQKAKTDSTQELHLINKITKEDRIIGRIGVYGTGVNEAFSKDHSHVVFAKEGISLSYLDSGLVVYSIKDKKILSDISLLRIKAALPQLQIPRNASLSYVAISPSHKRVASSYGYILEGDYGSDIIIYDRNTDKISTISAKGLVKEWKDDHTLSYVTIDPNEKEGMYYKRIIKNVYVP